MRLPESLVLLVATAGLGAGLVLGVACRPPVPGEPEVTDETWRSALLAERASKDEELRTSSSSPMAGTQYLKSEPTEEVFLTREGKSFGMDYLATETASLRLTNKEGVWHWTSLEEGVECRIDGARVEEGSALESYAEFEIAGLDLSFYPAEDRVTVIVFDPERPEMTAFEHLYYFPPNRELAVEARLEELATPEKVEMPTSRNLIKTFFRVARVRFSLAGEEYQLSAFKTDLEGDGSGVLFIPFKDTTSGRETYGAGRFMEIEEPSQERFTLDLNRAFNPLCNYSPAYNCTIPPRENHLAAAIRAGEKTYPTEGPGGHSAVGETSSGKAMAGGSTQMSLPSAGRGFRSRSSRQTVQTQR